MDHSPAAPERHGAEHPQRQRLWPLVAPVLGAVLSGIAALEVFGSPPAERGGGFLLPLLAALALTAGGWSALRLLQLRGGAVRAATERPGTGRVGAVQAIASSADLHRIWLLGVAGSLALMGLLGLWSLADGLRSGLEPGWPLLLGAAVVALGAQRACSRVQALVARAEEQRLRAQHEEHQRLLEDPLGRIRRAADRAAEPETTADEATAETAGHDATPDPPATEATPEATDRDDDPPAPQGPDVTAASSDSHPGSDPSSAGTR